MLESVRNKHSVRRMLENDLQTQKWLSESNSESQCFGGESGIRTHG